MPLATLADSSSTASVELLAMSNSEAAAESSDTKGTAARCLMGETWVGATLADDAAYPHLRGSRWAAQRCSFGVLMAPLFQRSKY